MAFKLSGVPSAASASSGSDTVALTHAEFLREWDWVWITQDVEAAAELGRTLLERNRELEATVRQQQALIDDQALEMQYLSKQNRLLRQAAESRLRLCEQLEASVADGDRSRARLRHQIEVERQRYTTLKTNLEAAVERGDELQRLLDSSRSAESHARSVLRTLQQQQRQQQQLLRDTATDDDQQQQQQQACCATPFDTPLSSLNHHETNGANNSGKGGGVAATSDEASTAAVCQLIDELADVEERLHQMETDWMDEKKRRIHSESEALALQQENHRLQQALASVTTQSSACSGRSSTASTCSSNSGGGASLPPVPSLSLSEELLISSSSSDYAPDAWDHSGPVSLIGALRTGKPYSEPDEEFSSSDSSASSGFADENRTAVVHNKAIQTEPCHHASIATSSQDIKTLFDELFDIIHKNL